MDPEKTYRLLQKFRSPLVAVTSLSRKRTNGMIANSAVRASLVPEVPRLAFYCFKRHYTHELIEQSGRFCLHLLHQGQIALVKALGFESGRDRNKLDNVNHRTSSRGLPLLEDVYAAFECRVINAMDAGPSTFFLGDVLEMHVHPDLETLRLLNSQTLQEQLSPEWIQKYQQQKKRFQAWAGRHTEVDRSFSWSPPDDADDA